MSGAALVQHNLIGKIALQRGLITPEQLADALRAQALFGHARKFGEVLVDLGHVTAEQLGWLLKEQERVLAAQRGVQAEIERAVAVEHHRETEGGVALSRPGAALVQQQAANAHTRALDGILTHGTKLHASDVHVHAGAPVQMRIAGKLLSARQAPLAPAATEAALVGILDAAGRRELEERQGVDFAYTVPGVARFRVSIYRQRRGLDGVFRPIAAAPPTLASLGLPTALARLTGFHQGLVLLTGPAGCGKSSTLAALVDLVNEERRDHIITVEDPIEFLHPSKRCVVTQRQVRRHTESFATALRAALREDPDVIAIGELRDLETVQLAITAAETGHLVLATLHTGSAVRTVSRMLDVFPPAQQPQVRAMLAESLRAVVSQRLLPAIDGSRMVPACEMLFMTHAVANLVRDEKLHQIRTVLQTGRAQGMCLLDDALQELVRAGTVDVAEARRHAEDKRAFA